MITGLGPVTSIGIGNDSFWEGLTGGRAAAAKRRLHTDLARGQEFFIASMPPEPRDSSRADAPAVEPRHYPVDQKRFAGYRDLSFAMTAIDLALGDANLEYDPADNRIGVIQAFEAPGMERAVAKMFQTCAALPPPEDGPPALYEMLAPYFYNLQAFMYVHAIGKAFGFHGFSTSVHNACSSGAFAIEIAAQQIRSGQADVMIVAGGEAFDTGVRIEWFRQLGLYSRDGVMRPFDAQPAGFYAGEAGAAIVLESHASADRRGVRPYAEYLGGAFAQQGWKESVPDVRANRLCDVIKNGMATARTSADEIDLVVPHGASTTTSDGYEATCIRQAFENQATPAVATVFKPYVGHTLAASAVIETAAALLSMRHGVIPATLNTRPDSNKLPIPLITENTTRNVNTLLKLSTGFTGHDAAMIFRRAD